MYVCTGWTNESVNPSERTLHSENGLQLCYACRDQTKILLGKHFNSPMEDIFTTDRLIFGDYLVPGADPPVYAQVTDMTRLVKVD